MTKLASNWTEWMERRVARNTALACRTLAAEEPHAEFRRLAARRVAEQFGWTINEEEEK